MDPIILPKHTYMQRIADYVRQGYHYHISGTVTAQKAPRLVAKFVDLFGADADRNRRHRAKAKGLANAHLLLHAPKSLQQSSDCSIYWVLLFTNSKDTDSYLKRVEQLTHQRPVDARDKQGRIEITGYELVIMPKPLKQRTEDGKLLKVPGKGKEVWTWKMTSSTYEDWRERMIQVIRFKSELAFKEAHMELFRSPGFWGIRSQIGKIAQLINAEWKRTRGAGEEPPQRRLGYIQRQADKGPRLSSLMRYARAIDRMPPPGPEPE